jgi:beta-lactam-binding protein with PASTA domain
LAVLLIAGAVAAVLHSGTGRTTVAVPRLVDHNAAEAERLLNEQELIGEPSTASRDGCAANMVLQQATTAGARVATGTHIRYAVCAASQPAQRIVVPNGVGMNYQDAQDLWRGAGLHVAPAVDALGAHRLPIIDSNWVVLRQSPAAGTTVDTGTFITATVKKYTDN